MVPMLATRLALIGLFLIPSLASCTSATDTSATPRAGGALLISVDGLRPDLILRADAPNLRDLMARGSFSLSALTVPVAVTLPSHASMLTGVPPEVHGVTWNGDPPSADAWPLRPTLFAVAKRAGYRTAMAAGKSKFIALAVPGTLDRSFVPSATLTDRAVADTAAHWIATDPPGVLFVHLPNVDTAGHQYGWGSDEQLDAIAEADRCIGRLLAALEKRGTLGSTVVLATADHGGSGRTHGRGDELSLHIPWIIAGPGIRAGHDLSGVGNLVIHTEDSFATLCALLSIPVDGAITGRVVDTGAPTAASRAVEAHAAGR